MQAVIFLQWQITLASAAWCAMTWNVDGVLATDREMIRTDTYNSKLTGDQKILQQIIKKMFYKYKIWPKSLILSTVKSVNFSVTSLA